MPEGHVIHRLAAEIKTTFAGAPVQVTSPQGRFSAADSLDQTRIAQAEAWGKHLFILFDAPQPEHIIHIHLGLIGTLRFSPLAPPVGQVRLRIANDSVAADLRGPQWCRLITPEAMAQVTSKLGADPLRIDADYTATWHKVQRSSRSIGSLLMDQKLFAGVGNIYRAESLFRLGISPTRTGRDLLPKEFDELWADLVLLMQDGVRTGRIDTVRPQHTPEAMGREPRKDDHGGEVYVYRRSGEPCFICQTPISHSVYEGRNLFWCPSCQKLRE
ncbi:Fpg/Nei family DNA glycosylase [Corynebacterium freiburgense]|uniref:Fpg/Nei family DNA glycosylase n=1 Tax=Corynebacterium freiburgense TaxID=556548 RepID=UPI0003FA172C|nr:DNA-formamidopyrimidine glycosylase family protein [Corynebacterium freiburgense]WJZ03945.1 Endonuclease 8 1 [Corynebacterium freiburgense]